MILVHYSLIIILSVSEEKAILVVRTDENEDTYTQMTNYRQHKILIVDDDEATRLTLQDVLLHDGYFALCAGDGSLATHIVRKSNLDLVFLDFDMPDMHGIDVLKAIKEINRNLPVVMLSGTCREDIFEWAMENGAYSLISKPVELQLFRTTARNALIRFHHDI